MFTKPARAFARRSLHTDARFGPKDYTLNAIRFASEHGADYQWIVARYLPAAGMGVQKDPLLVPFLKRWSQPREHGANYRRYFREGRTREIVEAAKLQQQLLHDAIEKTDQPRPWLASVSAPDVKSLWWYEQNSRPITVDQYLKSPKLRRDVWKISGVAEHFGNVIARVDGDRVLLLHDYMFSEITLALIREFGFDHTPPIAIFRGRVYVGANEVMLLLMKSNSLITVATAIVLHPELRAAISRLQKTDLEG